MIYLLYGKDGFRKQEKLKELLDFFQTKISSLGIFKVDEASFVSGEFEELTKSQTLFEKKYVVVCSQVLENSQAQDFFKKNIELISTSSHVFIFDEEEVEASLLEIFKTHSQKAQEFKLLTGVGLKKWMATKAGKMPLPFQQEIIKKCGSDLWCAFQEIEKYELTGSHKLSSETTGVKYSPFAICDAVAEKNNARAWILLQQALLSGVDAEEIFWKVWWQIKNLLLIKKLFDAKVGNFEKETGLHPYVVKKNLSAIHNFSEKELRDYSFGLLKMFHDIRKGNGPGDISTGLESFLLSL